MRAKLYAERAYKSGCRGRVAVCYSIEITWDFVVTRHMPAPHTACGGVSGAARPGGKCLHDTNSGHSVAAQQTTTWANAQHLTLALQK
jgi:hypothetical protein